MNQVKRLELFVNKGTTSSELINKAKKIANELGFEIIHDNGVIVKFETENSFGYEQAFDILTAFDKEFFIEEFF